MEESKKATQAKTNVSKSSEKQKSAPEKKGESNALIRWLKSKKDKISAFWKGLKSEYPRIAWPTREVVGKQTFAVVVICAIVAALIGILDYGFGAGLNFLQTL